VSIEIFVRETTTLRLIDEIEESLARISCYLITDRLDISRYIAICELCEFVIVEFFCLDDLPSRYTS
jgi:hypothetical protein